MYYYHLEQAQIDLKKYISKNSNSYEYDFSCGVAVLECLCSRLVSLRVLTLQTINIWIHNLTDYQHSNVGIRFWQNGFRPYFGKFPDEDVCRNNRMLGTTK